VLALDRGAAHRPGRAVNRRLNKTEYNNTIRDLLYLKDFHGADDFPADDRGYGFDNNGALLTLSPVLIEHYLKASQDAVNAAFADPQAKTRLTRAGRGQSEDFADFQKRVRPVVEEFARRAYRRPVTAGEVDRLMSFAALSFAHDGESVDKAMSLPMRAALMSPDFLFRVERDPDPPQKSRAAPVNEFELASRLSYFLWSSMPDEELFQLAAERKLRHSLEAQVARMLHDPRAAALTQSFAGQWLEIRGLEQVQRDREMYPDFTPELCRAMKGETDHFFAAIVNEDLSIMNFLDADFTYVNEPLAKLYGIPNIKGDEFQRVKLDPARRGGLLTQAAILTITSNPTRTSPVKRGKWILENIFNTPPPPPPPDVPPLQDDGRKITGTLRQVLEKHRADPRCSSCHERMDPLGLALENYDAIGAWRTRDIGGPVDPSGTLSTGEKFNSPQEFRALMAARRSQFRRGLAAKMLTYAIGRGLEYDDTPAIDAICDAVAHHEDRFSALVIAIINSDPFQYRAAQAGAK
jgi:hypothetical protein